MKFDPTGEGIDFSGPITPETTAWFEARTNYEYEIRNTKLKVESLLAYHGITLHPAAIAALSEHIVEKA